jgi:hypothetical protein
MAVLKYIAADGQGCNADEKYPCFIRANPYFGRIYAMTESSPPGGNGYD